MQLWQPFIAPSLKQLQATNRATNRSIGIIKPDPGSVRFVVKPAKDAEAATSRSQSRCCRCSRPSFLEDPLTPLEPSEFAYSYRYTSAGHPHDQLIHDWEVQEAYRQYKRRYGANALDHLKRMYGAAIPARNLASP